MERRFIKGDLLSAHPEVGSLRAAHRSKNRDGWGNHSMEESRRGPASRGRIIEEVLHSDCWSSFCRSSGMEHAVDRLKELQRSEEHTSELQSLTNLVCR